VTQVQFTGRVHMSGYTAPLTHLSQKDLGMATGCYTMTAFSLLGRVLITDSGSLALRLVPIFVVFHTFDISRNFLCYSIESRLASGETPDRSVWKGATKSTVTRSMVKNAIRLERMGSKFQWVFPLSNHHRANPKLTNVIVVDKAERVLLACLWRDGLPTQVRKE